MQWNQSLRPCRLPETQLPLLEHRVAAAEAELRPPVRHSLVQALQAGIRGIFIAPETLLEAVESAS